MIEYNKVFLDTTPLIYFLDEDESFGEKTRAIFEEIVSNGKQMVSSSVTCVEYMVYPYKTGNHEKIKAFNEFIEDVGVRMLSIDVAIAHKAAQIRAEYPDFKTMDALQLAAAIQSGCDLFLTNDKQLRQFEYIKCITVEEWVLEFYKNG